MPLNNSTAPNTPSVGAPRFTTLSAHARLRLKERVGAKEKAILGTLNRGEYVAIGIAPGGSEEHLLFYCENKAASMVAVRDFRSLEVITFLTLPMQETRFALPEGALERSRTLAQTAPKVMQRLVELLGEDGITTYLRSLGSVPAALYDCNPWHYIKQSGGDASIDELARVRGIDPRLIFRLIVKFKGAPPAKVDRDLEAVRAWAAAKRLSLSGTNLQE